MTPTPTRKGWGFHKSRSENVNQKGELIMLIVIKVADLLLPRLVTIPFERAEVPVQKELDRMRAELEEIIDDYEKTIRSLNK